MGFDASYLKGSGPWRFWGAIATLFLLANAALFAACILLPRSWQKHSGTDLNTEPRKFEFISEAKPWRRPALGDGKPFVWLALGNLTGQSAMRRMLVLIGPLWAVSLVFLLDHNHNFPFAIVLAFALHFAAKILIAAESGRRLYQDRQSGALELLLVTPLSDREIVAGQREALWKQYRRALWVVTVVNAVTFVVYVMGIIGDSWDFFESEEIVGALLVFLSSVTLLWLDASALIWLGMWRGLNGRKYPRSVLATLGQVMLPPWLLSVLFAVISFASANRAESVFVLIVLWFGVGVAIDVPTIRVARESLGRSFRSVVSGGSGG
jgi:hypothetical protein